VRLHAHNRILLRIEINASVVHLYPNEVLIQLFSVAQEGLLRHKLEEPRLLRRVGKELAFQDPAQLFALLKERDRGGFGSVNGRHFEMSGDTADKRAPTLATFFGLIGRTVNCSYFLIGGAALILLPVSRTHHRQREIPVERERLILSRQLWDRFGGIRFQSARRRSVPGVKSGRIPPVNLRHNLDYLVREGLKAIEPVVPGTMKFAKVCNSLFLCSMFCISFWALSSPAVGPNPELVVTKGLEGAVLTIKSSGAEGNKYGFEGGRVLKLNGAYHLFTSEMIGDPHWVKMRLAHWVSKDRLHWNRLATLAESSGDFTGKDPRAALWSPLPVYNPADNRWNLFYVAYQAVPDTAQQWLTNHEGRIWRAVSNTPGWMESAGRTSMPE
jgi:hypothetical protein